MNYICIFSLIFLGIMGTISCIKALGEAVMNSTKPPPNIVSYCNKDGLEYRVRTLLKVSRADVVILLPESADRHSEYYQIADKLAQENGRVIIKHRKRYIRK